MTTALVLLLIQGCLGAFDTLWYHEFKLRLSRDHFARFELTLHAGRDFIYAVIFGSLAWVAWNGFWVWILFGLLISEVIITLWDFIEEDRARKVPAGERVMHAIMGLTYGAFLACFVPEIIIWLRMPTGFSHQSYGLLSLLLTAMAIGVTISGLRDLAAASIRHRTDRLKVPVSV
jgi:uncharacterized protein